MRVLISNLKTEGGGAYHSHVDTIYAIIFGASCA